MYDGVPLIITTDEEGVDRNGRTRGPVANYELLTTIPGNRGDLNPLTGGGRSNEALVREASSPTSPSLLRSISNAVKTRILAGPSSPRRAARYETIDDGDTGDDRDGYDLEMGTVPVDLTTLAGLGFEEHDMTAPQSYGRPRVQRTPSLTPIDTAYKSPEPQMEERTGYAAHRLRRRLGQGLNDGIRLERTSTVGQQLKPQDLIQRSRTVRDLGQKMAEQRNTIVAVEEEPFDLSNFEGVQPRRRETGQSFDDIGIVRTNTAGHNPTSYFFPSDPNVPDWKPFSLRGAFILSLTMLALALAGVQEYLCQWSLSEERNESGILAFDSVADVSVGDFFAWKYLPTMITIIYAVLFSIMDFNIRRLEPYYQLSQPKGSTAAASLNLDHLTMFQYFVPFKALRLKQYAVAFSTFGNIIAATVAPALQNPSFNFVENNAKGCELEEGCPRGKKKYFVRIDPVWSRLMTTSYILIALITIVLFVQMRRKSGLLSDPKGIAGIASMATKSHILQDFRGMDIATREQIHKRLAHRRFVLYQSSIWQGEWNPQNGEMQEIDKRLKSPHPPMLRLSAAVPFIGYMVVCLVMVPLISLTELRIIPNQAPWAPILVATILKLIWSTFEADVRLMEPFYQLSKGGARPEDSLCLDYQASVYGFMPFVATFNGHYLVALVGICSVCLDILSVTAGSFSVTADISASRGAAKEESYDDETSVSFLASLILSMVILVFVIFTTILVYVRRRHPFLPREPSTIAAVLAFIYSSKMLDDFIDTERLTSSQIEKRLKKLGKTYSLAWFRGRDGQVHCAIDEEPRLSKYVHGSPYFQALIHPYAAHDTF